MIHELCFAAEFTSSRILIPKPHRAHVQARVAEYRVPRFGVVGMKVAQVAANRPDLPISPQMARALSGALVAGSADSERGARASFGTVYRSKNGRCIKRSNSWFTRYWLATASWALNECAPSLNALTLAPLAEEARLEREHAKNVALREHLGSVKAVVVPHVISSSRSEVVMDYVTSTLARDVTGTVPLGDVDAFFRGMVTSMFRSGTWHCDLHAGNVGVRRCTGGASNTSVEFVVYDFGAVRNLSLGASQFWYQCLPGLLEAYVMADWACLTRQLLDRGILKRGEARDVRRVVEGSVSYARGQADFSSLRPLFADIRGSVALDSDIAAAIAALTVLEATCKRMNPRFTLAGSIQDLRSF